MPPLPLRSLVKTLAWRQIIGGAIFHPIYYIARLVRDSGPEFKIYNLYVMQDAFYLIFGSIGWVTGGVVLLLALDIGTLLKKNISQEPEGNDNGSR